MGNVPQSKGAERIWIQEGKTFRSVGNDELDHYKEKGAIVLEHKPLPPSGSVLGRLYGIYDIGTQHVNYTYGGKVIDKWQRKVILFFEIPAYRCIMTTKDDTILDRPLSINKEYTYSTSAKGNLRKDITSWQGEDLLADEGFKMESLINSTVQLIINRKKSEAGRERADITALAPLMEGMPEPEPENDPITFFLDEDLDINEHPIVPPDYLPEWLAKKVMDCLEITESREANASMAAIAGSANAAAEAAEEQQELTDVDEDVIPF